MIRWITSAGIAACLALCAASALPAIGDIGKLAAQIAAQSRGVAQATDFLNLYTGADLVLHAPRTVYDLGAQLAVQQRLTGSESTVVPFFLPPYATPLVSWLALLPYDVAYLAWMAIGVGCLALAAALGAPHWGGRWYPLVWVGFSVLYLPAFLGVALGQTSAVMLLGFVALSRFLRREPSARWRPALGVLTWTIKPQLAAWLVVSLLLARRGDIVLSLAGMLSALTVVAVVVLTSSGLSAYAELSRTKLHEVFVSDPGFLPGPTLLHASQWLLGSGWPANAVAAVLVGLTLAACWLIWRDGLRRDDAVLPQLAALPIVSIICAPYALVHELTAWMASFWLLWEYTRHRPAIRAVLLWFTAGVWFAGDVGVVTPVSGGSDLAAILGLCMLCVLAWLVRRPLPARTVALDATRLAAPRTPVPLVPRPLK